MEPALPALALLLITGHKLMNPGLGQGRDVAETGCGCGNISEAESINLWFCNSDRRGPGYWSDGFEGWRCPPIEVGRVKLPARCYGKDWMMVECWRVDRLCEGIIW